LVAGKKSGVDFFRVLDVVDRKVPGNGFFPEPDFGGVHKRPVDAVRFGECDDFEFGCCVWAKAAVEPSRRTSRRRLGSTIFGEDFSYGAIASSSQGLIVSYFLFFPLRSFWRKRQGNRDYRRVSPEDLVPMNWIDRLRRARAGTMRIMVALLVSAGVASAARAQTGDLDRVDREQGDCSEFADGKSLCGRFAARQRFGLRSTGEVDTSIHVGAEPVAIAVNEATDRIYVANNEGGSVSVIDGKSDSVLATLQVGPAALCCGGQSSHEQDLCVEHVQRRD